MFRLAVLIGAFLIFHHEVLLAKDQLFESVADLKIREKILAKINDEELRLGEADSYRFSLKELPTVKRSKGKCYGKYLYFINDGDFQTNSEIAMDAKSCGSAGCRERILLADGKSNSATIVYDGNLIDISGLPVSQESKSCPDIEVILHGSEFRRIGNLYGKAHLQFNKGRFELLRQRGKVKEYK